MVNILPSFEQGQKPHQHELNMAETLAHRAEVAYIHQDLQLLKLLQKEQQQLNSHEASSQFSINLWEWLTKILIKRSQISVEKIQTASGQVAWRVSNPRTGQSRYAENLVEIVAWLEADRFFS